MDKRLTRVLLIVAAAHFSLQVAILWFAPWDYTPGQPTELLAIAERWNWVGAVVSFPLITFSVYFPFQLLEGFIGNYAPFSWISFCLIDSILWGVVVSVGTAGLSHWRERETNKGVEAPSGSAPSDELPF
jgi:hypothetical protein